MINRKGSILSTAVAGMLFLSACAQPVDTSAVSTSAAQTVEARFTQMAAPSETAAPSAPIAPPTALTPGAGTPIPAPTQAGGPTVDCLKASLVGETIPDGTILKPGEIFTKTWTIKNTGTCTWDQTYKVAFWGGDLMGGAYTYDFPAVVFPEQSIEIPILFYAPQENGTYTGYWRIQSPNSIDFGVGEYNNSIYVNVAVSDARKPGYGVSDVSFQLVRDPQYGCPANVLYTVYATITVTGPTDIWYHWEKSDGTKEQYREIQLESAGSITLKDEWWLNRQVNVKDRWIRLVFDEPEYIEYGKVTFFHECTSE